MSTTSEPPPMKEIFKDTFTYSEPPTYGVEFKGNCFLGPYYNEINSKTNKLRTVQQGDFVLDEDVNEFIDLLKSFDNLNKAIISCVEGYGFTMSDSLKGQIQYFSDRIYMLEMVKAGMFVHSDLWNEIVELMKLEYDILNYLKNELYPSLITPSPVFKEEFTYNSTPPTYSKEVYQDKFTYLNTPPSYQLKFTDNFNW